MGIENMNCLLVYRWSDLPRLAGLALAYALLAKITIGYFAMPGEVAALWPPSGLALAALLIGGKKYWPGIFIAVFAANLADGRSVQVSTLFALGNTLEPLVGAWLLTRMVRFDTALTHPHHYLSLCLAGAASAGVGGIITATLLLLAGFLTQHTFAHNVSNWWRGDLFGIFLITPFILVWRQWHGDAFWRIRFIEAVACFGLAFLFGQVIFFGWFHDVFGQMFAYWMFLFVVWSAVRFGRHGVMLVITMTAVQALLGTVQGKGAFANDLHSLDNFWPFIVVLAVVGIALALSIHERAQEEKKSTKLKKELEEFFDLVPDMVCIASSDDGYFKKLNHAWEAVLGFTQQELMAQPLWDCIHPEDRAATVHEVKKQIAGLSTVNFSNRYRCKDGSYKWLEWVARPTEGNRLFAAARDITERKHAEELQQRLFAVIEATSDFVGFADAKDTHIIYINRAGRKMTGIGEDEDVTQLKIADVYPEWQNQKFRDEIIPDTIRNGSWAGESAFPNRVDGREIPVMMVVMVHKSASGEVEIFSTISRDITERKKAEEQIKNSLAEKNMLLREIHHRVKNNLQIVISLLRLQSRQIKDLQYMGFLKDIQSRINAMSLIHERLYRSADLSKIGFKDYIKSLIEGLMNTYDTSGGRIAAVIDTEAVSLNMDKAIPCGLIINELITNAIKYAFPGERQGELKILLRQATDHEVELIVRDNGIGIPQELDIRDTKTLGMQLITSLAEDQLKGKLELVRGNGTEFRLRFGV